MRINKFLAHCGLGARRKCEELVLEGRVAVNGIKINGLGSQVDEENDVVTLDGREIKIKNTKLYVLLNKPKGYLTSVSDDRGRKTVRELIHVAEQIYPVGRLDFDTSGVLLVTNDGELAHRLMHPRYEITKEYLAILNRPFQMKDQEQFEKGIELEEGLTAPCHAFPERNPKSVRVIIHEGRKRQVKRMFRALGYRVVGLERTSFAGLRVDGMRRGEWRNLSEEEISLLNKKTGLS